MLFLNRINHLFSFFDCNIRTRFICHVKEYFWGRLMIYTRLSGYWDVRKSFLWVIRKQFPKPHLIVISYRTSSSNLTATTYYTWISNHSIVCHTQNFTYEISILPVLSKSWSSFSIIHAFQIQMKKNQKLKYQHNT